MVKPKDNTTTNLQSGLPALDPNVQVEPVPTPGQQSQIISDFEKTTGKTFTPTTTEPTTFVGQPKPDTRSVQQKRIDTSAQLEADKQIDTSGFSQTDGVYIKKNNKWRFIPRNKFLDGVNPGSLMFEEEFAPGKFQTQQFGAKGPEVIPIIGTVISHPFKFFKRAGSAAIKKTEPLADSLYRMGRKRCWLNRQRHRLCSTIGVRLRY